MLQMFFVFLTQQAESLHCELLSILFCSTRNGPALTWSPGHGISSHHPPSNSSTCSISIHHWQYCTVFLRLGLKPLWKSHLYERWKTVWKIIEICSVSEFNLWSSILIRYLNIDSNICHERAMDQELRLHWKKVSQGVFHKQRSAKMIPKLHTQIYWP